MSESVDGRYPYERLPVFKKENIVMGMIADGDELVIRLHDRQHEDFWISIRVAREEIERVFQKQ